jgi:hypothetical protein
LGAWFLQVISASIFALFVLLPLHPLPDNAFPKLNKENGLPFSWLRHQLEVTNDLKENNWFGGMYWGILIFMWPITYFQTIVICIITRLQKKSKNLLKTMV